MPEVLFDFTVDGMEFSIIAGGNSVFLGSRHINQELESLPIPVPGSWCDEISPSSYDRRGENLVEFSVKEQGGEKTTIIARVVQKSEYWRCGSLGDDWHPEEDTQEEIVFSVQLTLGGFKTEIIA
jgi:hypothetical protein